MEFEGVACLLSIRDDTWKQKCKLRSTHVAWKGHSLNRNADQITQTVASLSLINCVVVEENETIAHIKEMFKMCR